MTSGNEMIPARRMPRQDVATPAAGALATVSKPPVASTPRWSRRRGVVGIFAAFAVVGFAAAYIGPTGVVLSEAQASEPITVSLYSHTLGDAQTLSVEGVAEETTAADFDRGGYTVYVTPTPTPTPTPEPEVVVEEEYEEEESSSWVPPFITPDPGSAQAIAYDMVRARGWGDDQFSCLVALWNRESGWRVNAYNPSSGAYGIPQSLPGNKMASHGADWETNPATQIAWGLDYIAGRYGTPCGAWDHSESVGWY